MIIYIFHCISGVVFVGKVFLFVGLFEGVGGFVINVALRCMVFSCDFLMGCGGCIHYYFMVFMGWYCCVCFVVEAGRPVPRGFMYGGNFLRFVIFFLALFLL